MRDKRGFSCLMVVLVAAAVGGWLGDRISGPPPTEEGVQRLLKILAETFVGLQNHYVRSVSSRDLVGSAIRGMLRTLDPHSTYFPVSEYARLQEEQQGRYYGLGIRIRPERPGSGRVLIVEPPALGTPAYAAGLRAGDVISKIDGEPTKDWEYPDEVVPRLKGEKGTRVSITIERPDKREALQLQVERDEILLYTVQPVFHIREDIGYIQISRFSDTTVGELGEALKVLDEVNLKGLVLDLRDNPGGALEQAIGVADRFLEKGQLIVRTRGRKGDSREYRALRGRRHIYPLVLLINQNSASASEIVAGALQDHDRALIVGKTSFGKALVQTIFTLKNRRGLALTTGRYFTPRDRLIQRNYEESFYQYYNSRKSTGAGEEHQTNGGRRVLGGGGIAPDEEVSEQQTTRFMWQIDRQQLFYRFVEKLTQGELVSDVRYHYGRDELNRLTQEHREKIIEQMAITERTILLFREFLRDGEVHFTSKRFEKSRHLIENRIRREMVQTLFGEKEGRRIESESDFQLQRALELIPRAQALMGNNGTDQGS